MPQKRKKATSAPKIAEASAERRIAAYEKEFVRLEGERYKLEAENARLKARIRVLEEAKPAAVAQTMTDEELQAAIAQEIEHLGYVKKGK